MKHSSSLTGFQPCNHAGKIAAIYVRVSQREFDKSNADKNNDTGANRELRQSVKTQKSRAIDLCKANGWDYEVYDQDCELSGTLPASADGRPDLARLLADVEAKKVHTVIVRDLSRFARNSHECLRLLEDYLLPNGVVLHGLDQNLDITTPNGRMFLTILAAIAQWEVEQFRQVSSRNRDNKAREGTLALNPYTYGFTNNSGHGPLEIVPREAEQVQRIFSMYAGGMSYVAIANQLNDEGVPTKWKGHINGKKDNRDALWAGAQIQKTLKNVRYIGKISYNSEIYDSPFPRIISDELWDATQKALKARSGPRIANNNYRHLLSGILQCGYCVEDYEFNVAAGKRITRNMVMSQVGTRKTKIHYYYTCQTRNCVCKDHCRGVRVRKDDIEAYIANFIGAFSVEQYRALVPNKPEIVDRLEREIAALKEDLAKVETKKAQLVKKFMESDDVPDVLLQADNQCSVRITKLRNRIDALEAELDEVAMAPSVEAFNLLKQWDSLDLETKRKALKNALPKVLVYDDRMEMYLGNLNNPPVKAEFDVPMDRRKRSQVPKPSKWPRFVDDDHIMRYGMDVGAAMKACQIGDGEMVMQLCDGDVDVSGVREL